MLKIRQPKDGYKYNSDTIALYGFVSLFKPHGEILEIGSGCGILSLLFKRDFDCNVFGVEKQLEMYELSLKNSKENDIVCEFFHDDFESFKSEKKFDFIVSNPPFYDHTSSTSANISKQIARYDDNLTLENFVRKANSLIKTNGELIFCYDSGKIQNVLSKLTEYKLNVKTIRFVYGSDDKNSNIVLLRAVKSKVKNCEVMPSFYFFKNGQLTEEAKKLTEKSDTESVV